MAQPNLIERMENLIHSLDEARDALTSAPDWQPDDPAITSIDNAYGIAGEILTMIDGR
jgi:hypothetical protein